MATYTETDFINLYDDPLAKLEQLRAIVDALDTLAPEIIAKGGIKSYTLDDRQVTISRNYSSMKEITAMRLSYTQEINRIIAGIEGRTTFITPTC